MDIQIQRLSPDLAEDYVHFFDTTPHFYENDNRCYCTVYCNDDYEEIKSLVTTQEAVRIYTKQCIKSNKLQGYLAYHNDKIVGWCNANTKSDCTKCNGWICNLSFVHEEENDELVKSVFCFVIAPDMRRKGIAKLLLERVCKDAAQDGFNFVEVYPDKKFIDEFNDYQGPFELYSKSGFTVNYESERKFVMRKSLK